MKLKVMIGAAVAGCALAMCVPMHAQMNGMGSAAAMQAANDPTKNGMAGGASSGMDATFLKKAAAGGMKEIEASKVALDKSQNADVKTYAQKMIDDHTAMGDKVKAVAGQMNVMLPTEPMKADRADIDKLKAMDGAAFDHAYVKQMVADHKKTLALFKQEESGGTSPDVKQLASTGDPTIAEHLRMAEDMQKKGMK